MTRLPPSRLPSQLPPRPRPIKTSLIDQWKELRPNHHPPRLPFSLPYISQEKADAMALFFMVHFLQFDQRKKKMLSSPVFAACLFFAYIGYYSTLRGIYRDQLWTYGLRQQLPGVAHQLQNQDFTTFQYVTAPTAVDQARRLGTKFSDSTESASPVIQFLETPFLKRLDMYPNVALFELSPQWSSCVGENYMSRHLMDEIYTMTLERMQPTWKLKDLDASIIPVVHTAATVHPVEYKPIAQIDPWSHQRLVFDLADEVPTRLDDAFGGRMTKARLKARLKAHPEASGELLGTFSAFHVLRSSGTAQGPSHSAGTVQSRGWSPVDEVTESRPQGPSEHSRPQGPLKGAFEEGPNKKHSTSESASISSISSPILAFQAFQSPNFPTDRPSMVGVPVAEVPTPQTKLPASMLASTEQTKPRSSGRRRSSLVDSAPRPRLRSRTATILGQAFGRRSLFALDRGLAAGRRPADLRRGPSKETFEEGRGRSPVPHGPSKKVLPSGPVATDLRSTAVQDPLGFSPSHPLRQSSWLLDFVGFTRDELQTPKPSLLQPHPEPPLGFEKYQARRRAKLTKKREEGPLVKIVKRHIVKRRKNLLKFPAQTRKQIEAFASYGHSLEIYRAEKLAQQSAERNYAPIAQKMQDLQHFWTEQLPQALLEHIQRLPQSSSPGEPFPKLLRRLSEMPEEVPDLTIGSFDWFAHLPTTQLDWYRLFFDVGARVTADTSPLTVADTRALVQRLFSSDFTKPQHFEVGRLKGTLLRALQLQVRKNRLDFYETHGQRDFYRQLQKLGLSAGPSRVTRGFLFRRNYHRLVPRAWRLTSPVKPSKLSKSSNRVTSRTVLEDRRFYQPLTDWMDHVFLLGKTRYDFRMPAGAEFHWALHAHNLAIRSKTTQEFVAAIAPQLEKIDPVYRQIIESDEVTNPNTPFNRARRERAQQLHAALCSATHDYLRSVEKSNLFKGLQGPGYQLASRLQSATTARRVANDLAQVIRDQGALALVGPYRANWNRPQPAMTRFLFPDTDAATLRLQILMSKVRYHLGSKSIWDGFHALTATRPLEIILPPGYRLFVARSLPDFSRPGFIDYQRVNVFPRYEVARQPSQLPSYDVLKNLYADLDISFLPDKPQPKLPSPRTFFDLERKKEVTIGVGPYANYFDYPKALARRDGDLDIPASVLQMMHHYYLGAQNWIKDVPRNFLGFQGVMSGDDFSPFIRQQSREQIKQSATPHEKVLFAGPEKEPNLPSQLEGQTRQSLGRSELMRRAEKKAIFVKKNYPFTKAKAQLEATRSLSLPQLSMDEWHFIFKTSLERARLTGEPTLNLDIPPIQPVHCYSPAAVEGMIHVDLLASQEKQRSQALAQILLIASEAKFGAYNLPDYLGPRGLQAAFPTPHPGVARTIVPVHWHDPVDTLNMKAHDLFNQTTPGRLQNVTGAWNSAEDYIASERRARQPWRRLPYTFLRWMRASIPVELVSSSEPPKIFEPLTIYSWFALSQLLILPAVSAIVQWFRFIVIRDFFIELHYRLYPFFGSDPYISPWLRRSLRRSFQEIGLIPRDTFRVFRNLKRRFIDIVGIEPEVLCRSGEIAVSLRARGRGGLAAVKGVLLYGPPGNGKTFLVQAIAGEANTPLVAVTTAELLDKTKYESSVEALIEAFRLAKKLAPCILFIDEIDGLGKKRSSMLAQEAALAPNPEEGLWPFVRTVPPRITEAFVNRSELNKIFVEAENLRLNPILAEKKRRERSIEGMLDRKRYNIDTEDDFKYELPIYEPPPPRKLLTPTESARVALLTAFLAIMDTLRPQDGIVVIGATNRLSVLDPAIRRFGRLDLHIGINAPFDERRVELMRFYTSRLGLQGTIPWEYMMERTRGFSISDLETMANQSAIFAIQKKEQHSLDSLEDALDVLSRHRHIRASRMLFPIVKKLPADDPLFFLRIAYYQASRALVHNILPDHPSLPFVQLQLEPFAPDVPFAEFVRRVYTLQDLEDRLSAMLAGKAGEFLLLYGSPFKTQEEINERQLFESNQGVEELGYAVDFAYAIVDQWLLIDDFTLPIRKALKLEAGENDDMFFEPGGDIGRPHFLRYTLEEASKVDARSQRLQTSMWDTKFRIHNSFVDTLRWFAESKASMNQIAEHFLNWSCFFIPLPFKRNMWEPVEQYYSKRPYFKVIGSTHRADSTVDKSGDQPTSAESLTNVKVRPTFPDLALIDRDYLMQVLLLKCFNKALGLLEEHRTVVERMAEHLLKHRKLRSFEMYAYIQAYTEELRAIQPTKVRTVPRKGTFGTLPEATSFKAPDLRSQPETRLQTINGRDYLVIDQSWGPDSLKPESLRLPMSVFVEGTKAPGAWSDRPMPTIYFEMRKIPIQEGEYLRQMDERLRRQRKEYTDRYDYVRQLHVELFNQKMAELRAQRDRASRFMEDLLLSMVPPLEAFLRQ